MNILQKLSVANTFHKSRRTVYLTALTIFMCFLMFSGTTVVMGLHNGLKQLQNRLGADIIVIPKKEAQKHSFEGILYSGKTGYFYFNKNIFNEISDMEGINNITAQYYLASVGADCCFTEVQLIGFDPDTDFIVKPWLQKNYNRQLLKGEVLSGSDVFIPDNGILKIYNNDLKSVGILERTGTGLDSTVFVDMETLKTLLRSSIDLGLNDYNVSPDDVVSSVMIKVKDGYSKFKLTKEINKRFKEVKAIENQDMIKDFAGKLDTAAIVVKIVVAVIWIMSLLVMHIYFSMSLNERKKEFAVLKVLGFTNKSIYAMILYELLIIFSVSFVLGLLMSSVWGLQLKTYLETRLEVPFMYESFSSYILHGGVAVAVSLLLSLIFLSGSFIRTVRMSLFSVLREVD